MLWTWGPLHDGSLGQLMATGTSPSMTILSNGSYEIAFQGANHDLWLYNQNNGAQDTGLGMDPASSPSITSEPNTGYEVAFEANTNNLWLVGSDNRGDTGLGMRAGSSPSITLPTGSGLRYQAAFVANTGILWTVGTFQNGSTGAAVASGSNPAITTLTQSGGFQIAYVAALAGGGAGGILETTGTDGLFNTETPVAPDTSPSITGMFIDGSCGDGSTGYRVAFDSGSAVIDPGGGKLVTESFGDGVGIATNSGQLMSPGSSPSITASNDHC